MMARAAIVAISAIVAALCGSASAREERLSPSLKFEQRTHDFGEVYRGEKLTHRFSFVNDGDAPLVIQGVHAACGCTVALAESGKEYKAGEKGHVEVRFDTTDFAGVISKTVSVMTNEKLMPDRALTVRATVKSEVEADPPLVDFGEVSARSGGERTVRIKPIGGFALSVTGIAFDDKLLDAKLGPRSESGEYDVTVKLRPGLSPQFIKSTISIRTNSARLAELPVPIRASVKGAIEIAPAYLEFGAVAARGQARRAVTVHGPAGSFDVKGHRVELNVNGRPVDGGTKLVKVTTEASGKERGKDRKKVTIELANDARHAGSVHGRLFLQTTDASQRELAVDFYAFFR